MSTVFEECATCAAKPGSPTLCRSCISNQALIYKLQGQVKKPTEVFVAIQECADGGQWLETMAIGGHLTLSQLWEKRETIRYKDGRFILTKPSTLP